MLPGLGLLRPEHAAAGNGLVKVHQMPVKVRAVHAGELRFAPHRHAAAAAHAGAVDHDRIHADDGFHTIGTGQVAHSLHHGQRADGNHLVILLPGPELFLQRLGHKALVAVGAVVGHDGQLGAGGGQLVLEDNQLLVAEADNQQ